LTAQPPLKVSLLTREYPPEVYGGAGVHVEYLARELNKHVELAVQCFGAPRDAPEVSVAHAPWERLAGQAPHLAALRTLSVDVLMAAAAEGANLVHTHTWYSNFAGHLSKLMFGIPHVMTSHSLEPLRPWKAEQLAGGYSISCFCEKTAIESADAIVAVSQGMRDDILRCYPNVDPARVVVIYNGIDTDEYRPDPDPSVQQAYGIDPARPSVVFVGRITRQKGVTHLLNAARHFAPEVQLVLCAGEPDTKEIGHEVAGLVRELESERTGVVWIEEMIPRLRLRKLLSSSTVFICPSVYEPFGIVNVEAMACGLPVVASKVGGIPEVVQDGETGFIVAFSPDPHGNPLDPEEFSLTLAKHVNQLVADRALAEQMGKAGRARAVDRFSWSSIGEQTFDLYQRLTTRPAGF
jgi:starch synthase